MKLKKHNYSATAAIVLYCFTSYKSFSYKRFTVLLVVITSLFSSYFYSQQVIISGIENIHISEGATIVAEKSKNEILLITSSSIKVFDKKSNEEISKNKILITKKEKSHKEELDKKIKSIKKTANSEKLAHLYETNSTFQMTNSILKQANSNQNNYDLKYNVSETNWIEYLYLIEVKQGVLFQVHNSSIVKKSFFTRPPPNSLI